MDARKFIEMMRSCEIAGIKPNATEIKAWWYLEKLIEDRDTIILDNKSIVLIIRALKALKKIINETLVDADDEFYQNLGLKDISDIDILINIFSDCTIQFKRRDNR